MYRNQIARRRIVLPLGSWLLLSLLCAILPAVPSQAAYAQATNVQMTLSPTQWIEQKAEALGQKIIEKASAEDLRSDSRVEKKYRLKIKDETQAALIKDEIYSLYGEPKKITPKALIWYVPNPNFGESRAAMSVVKLATNKQGQTSVVVKQLSREKRQRSGRNAQQRPSR